MRPGLVRLLRMVTVSLLAVGGVGLGAVPASAAEPDPVMDKAVFNNPVGTEAEQNAIFSQLARVIDRVPADGELELSWFTFDFPDAPDTATAPDLAGRLINAYHRGVSVKIILDQSQAGNRVWQRLQPVLGSNDTARSYLVHCGDRFPTQKRGCIGTRTISYSPETTINPYNHNKFLTASKIVLDNGTTVSDVVFQASSNLTHWDAVEAYNNALTFSDPATYQAYRSYFEDLRAYRYDPDGNNDYYRRMPTGTTYKAHFFPRQERPGKPVSDPDTDTAVSILNAVTACSYDDNGTRRSTEVRVAMWSFTRTEVARKLAALHDAGCSVEVVYTQANPPVLSALGTNIPLTKCNFNVGPGLDVRVHSKYVLIDGAYDDDTTPRTFMGSHNFAMSALRQADETLLRVSDRGTHDDYLHNFQQVRDTCRANGGSVH